MPKKSVALHVHYLHCLSKHQKALFREMGMLHNSIVLTKIADLRRAGRDRKLQGAHACIFRWHF